MTDDERARVLFQDLYQRDPINDAHGIDRARLDYLTTALRDERRRALEKAANWLRRQANAESNTQKREAFIEAHNVIRRQAEEETHG